MPSVRDTLVAAKKSVTDAIHKARQSNAEQIAELTKEFNKIQTGIGDRVSSINDLRNDLATGVTDSSLSPAVDKSVRGLKDRISEKLVDAEKVLKKLEKLGAKEEAQTMREGIQNLAGSHKASKGIGI